MDILNEIGSSRLYTLHSHTEFCDGRAQMEAFAIEAVSRGFSHYGFSPHCPVPIESSCNMSRSHVADYDREFDRICAKYGDKVRFFRSMEIDYLGENWGPASTYFDMLGLDYKIGSVHFIPSQDGILVDIDGRFENFRKKMSSFFHDDIRYVVETFYAQSCKMVETGGFDIIGHLDKIGHNATHYSAGIEKEPWYRALLDDLIDRVLAKGIIVEINTKSLADHGRFFPAVENWRRLIAADARIVVNSDAHVPALINAGRMEAYKIIDQLSKTDNDAC